MIDNASKSNFRVTFFFTDESKKPNRLPYSEFEDYIKGGKLEGINDFVNYLRHKAGRDFKITYSREGITFTFEDDIGW